MLSELMNQSRADVDNLVGAINGVAQHFDQQKQRLDLKEARKIGSEFLAQGDFSPQGLKSFAQQHKMSIPEMSRFVQVMRQFGQYQKMMAPKYTNVKSVDAQGNPTESFMPQDQAMNMGFHRTGTAPRSNLSQLIAQKATDESLSNLVTLQKNLKGTHLTLGQLIASKASGEPLDKLVSLQQSLKQKVQTRTGLQKEFDRYKANNPNYGGDILKFKAAMNAKDPVRMALSLAQNDMRVVNGSMTIDKAAQEYLQNLRNLRSSAKPKIKPPPPDPNRGEKIYNKLMGK